MKSSSLIKRFLLKILAAAAVIAIVLTWVLGFFRMSGNYMYPAVKDGDLCIVYKPEKCGINEVVLYRDDYGNLRLGRIVAEEGQSVDFPEKGGYLVDGYQPAEEITYETCADMDADVIYPLKIKKEMYFIMNDFRSDTNDSRCHGMIDQSRICGKLVFLLRRRGF